MDSAALGANLGQFLDVEKSALGVIAGKLRKELIPLGKITGPKKGLSLAVTARWGHIQKEKDIVMPGRGIDKEREYFAEEITAIEQGAQSWRQGQPMSCRYGARRPTTSTSTAKPTGATSQMPCGNTPSAATRCSRSG